MKRIKLFCMQKNEDDILVEWIEYHSYLFGIENIYMIDNGSNEKCQKILRRYSSIGLNVSSQPDYSKKGDYIFDLIKKNEKDCDFAIPIDIDEFVSSIDVDNIPLDYLNSLVDKCLSFDQTFYLQKYPSVIQWMKDNRINQPLYHFIEIGSKNGNMVCSTDIAKQFQDNERKNFIELYGQMISYYHPEKSLSCDRAKIRKIFDTLPHHGRYAFKYYMTSRNLSLTYENPIKDVLYFDIVNMEENKNKLNLNKKFFKPKSLMSLDHGNHSGKVQGYNRNRCFITPLILFHYHHRGIRKLVEKCRNDILGLGYVKNINNINELKEKIKMCVPGSHNIQVYLNFLQKGPYSLCMFENGLKIDIMSNFWKGFISKNDNINVSF
jgi:hypothetical protein